MAASEAVDGKYYQVVAPHSLSERLVVAARDNIYADFMQHCQPTPTDTILDVGVSDIVNDAANVLERTYPYPERITAAGIGAGAEFRTAYPAIAYRQIEANQRLPFADKSFDIASANAVLEHVGGGSHQELFVRELARVARKVFISVPHRYFPVEHHTAIPLLHFWDASFRMACGLLAKSEWTNEENLILMSKQRLSTLAAGLANPEIGYTGLRLGPFSSNLYLFADEPK